MSLPSLCEFLEWDTRFFGVRIARVAPRTLTRSDLVGVLEWVKREKIECLYFLCDAAEVECSWRVQRAGFFLTDVRLTFEAALDGVSSANVAGVRYAIPTDVANLKTIARVSHTNTRFFADPNFLPECCSALYEEWIQNSCHGFADAVLVATAPSGAVTGYVTCHKRSEARGDIGLIAVAPEARGEGLGRQLLVAALNWFNQAGCETVTVGTQSANIAAQRLYQQCGFLSREAHFWFHFWPAGDKRDTER